jgi:hypothetical protein
MTSEIARIEDESTAKAIVAASLTQDPFDSAPVHASSGETEKRGAGVPYVGFRGHKTKDRDGSLTAAGIQPLDFYLHSVTPIKLKPFSVHLLPGLATFYTLLDNQNNVQDVLFQNNDDAFAAGFREHQLAVVAVALGGGAFVPATISLRSGQTAALKKTLSLIQGDAANPNVWSKLSPKHAASAAVRFSGGRFRTDIWVEEERPAGNPKGEPYNLGKSRIYPTPAEEVEALNQWMVEDLQRIKYVVAAHNLKVERYRLAALKHEE